MTGPAFTRTIWRWHFYAGLFVLPPVILLALSGATRGRRKGPTMRHGGRRKGAHGA